MKIAFVYDALYPFVKGGGEKRYYELARRLRDRHEIHFISWRYWSGPASFEREGITYHGVGRPARLYGSDGRRTVAEAVLFAARLLPTLRRERFDIVDCGSVPFLPIFSCAASCRVSGSPLVITWFEYWDEYWRAYLGRRGQAARLIERLSTRFGDMHIAISDFTASRLSARRLSRCPLRVIELGVDLEPIRAVPDGPKRIDVLFAGRLTAQKNVRLLLEAVAETKRRGVSMSCGIIGNGPERGPLASAAEELGISQDVHFFGRIEDPQEFYRTVKEARVFVSPSAAEGFGLAVLEAMACGLPCVVVSSGLNASAQLVEDGVKGLVVSPSADELSTALGRVLSDGSLESELGQKARRFAEAFDWESLARKLEDSYRELLGARGSSTGRDREHSPRQG